MIFARSWLRTYFVLGLDFSFPLVNTVDCIFSLWDTISDIHDDFHHALDVLRPDWGIFTSIRKAPISILFFNNGFLHGGLREGFDATRHWTVIGWKLNRISDITPNEARTRYGDFTVNQLELVGGVRDTIYFHKRIWVRKWLQEFLQFIAN